MFVTTLSFFFFGILTALGVVIVDGWGFACSQFFFGRAIYRIVMNYMDHINTVMLLLTFFMFPTLHVQMIDMLFPILTIFSRAFIIACRYGLMSQARWEIIHEQNHPTWVKQDFIKIVWEHIEIDTILREINATKYRYIFTNS